MAGRRFTKSWDAVSLHNDASLCIMLSYSIFHGDATMPTIRNVSDAMRLRMKSMLDMETGCWEWSGSRTPLGYGQMRFRGTRWLSHRASWVIHFGDIPKDDNHYQTMGVLHRCDNPACVNPEHLFLGDQKANSLDSVSKGRWGRRGCVGTEHGRAILDDDAVRRIRAGGESVTNLAKEYGVSKSAIQHILKRRSWAHVKDI